MHLIYLKFWLFRNCIDHRLDLMEKHKLKYFVGNFFFYIKNYFVIERVFNTFNGFLDVLKEIIRILGKNVLNTKKIKNNNQ